MGSALIMSKWAGAGGRSVADVTAAVAKAADEGFSGVWLPQTFSIDALTALAVAGLAVPDIRLGTAVVPIQGRHPIPLAQQALTTAQAVGPERFTLGIGVTHALVSEGFYGIPYRGIVDVCREELQALAGLLGPEHKADPTGDHLTALATLTADGPGPGLVVAALGPKMLDLAGTYADGTVTWMTGPRLLREEVVPAISSAAEAAGRPAPRVIAGLPVCVTTEVSAAREAVRPRIQGASAMPSYRRALDAEGLDDFADLAVIGSADEVASRLADLATAGVTELLADLFGTPEEQASTATLLRSLAA